MSNERGNVWLAVGGLVMQDGKVLVVKKTYGPTKGLWTLPMGFVNADETVDMAIVREVKEETGLDAKAESILALRTGVLRKGVSDNLLIMRLAYVGGEVERCEREIETIGWLTPDELIDSTETVEFLQTLMREVKGKEGLGEQNLTLNRDYGYSIFKMFV
ncbi:MAG TPA: NUDIX hydrolase [Bacilli bacterium]|nr:NUDIX hydrolase [Bacilli bacterium]